MMAGANGPAWKSALFSGHIESLPWNARLPTISSCREADTSVLASLSFVRNPASHNPAIRRPAGEGIFVTRKTFQRNRVIVAASLDGATTRELALHFNLSLKSVTEIIRNERHRLELSPDPLYRALRQSGREQSELQ
jgi:hypothetical protein